MITPCYARTERSIIGRQEVVKWGSAQKRGAKNLLTVPARPCYYELNAAGQDGDSVHGSRNISMFGLMAGGSAGVSWDCLLSEAESERARSAEIRKAWDILWEALFSAHHPESQSDPCDENAEPDTSVTQKRRLLTRHGRTARRTTSCLLVRYPIQDRGRNAIRPPPPRCSAGLP